MATKTTTLDFIERAREMHGDRYDYSKSRYVNTSTKIKVMCREHGEFHQLPHNHLKGQNCPWAYPI